MRKGRLPLREKAIGRRHRSVDGRLSTSRDDELHRLEEPRRTLFPIPLTLLLVAVELVDGLDLPPFANRWAFALDDRKRDAVHEDDEVRLDRLFGSSDGELRRDDEVVVRNVVEVENANIAAWFAVLLDGRAVGEEGVGFFAGFDEARCGEIRELAGDFFGVIEREPRVEAAEGWEEPRCDDGVALGVAVFSELVGGDVAMAELF